MTDVIRDRAAADPRPPSDEARAIAAATGLRSVAEQLNTELDVLLGKTSRVGVPWSFDDIGERIGEAYRPAEKMVVECVESNLEELRGLADGLVSVAASTGADAPAGGGLHVPKELAALLRDVGASWPESDEAGIVALGRQWRQFAVPLQQLSAAARSHAEAGVTGGDEGLDGLREAYLGPESAVENLEVAVTGVELCASVVDTCAAAVTATKLAIVAVLAGHAARVAQAHAAAERTLGASLAELPAHAEVTRLHIARLVSLACDYIDAEGEFDFDAEDEEYEAEDDEAEDDEAEDDWEEDDDETAEDNAPGDGRVVRVTHRSSFPESWSEQQRDNAIHRAFRSAELEPDKQFWYGSYRGVQIEGYYDKRTNQPTVAFTPRMAPDVDNIPASARISFYHDSKGATYFGCGDDELDTLGYWVTADLPTPHACLDALAGVADLRAGAIAGWEMTGNTWQAQATHDGLRLTNEWNGTDESNELDDVTAVLVKYWRFLRDSDKDATLAAVGEWERDRDRVHPMRTHLADSQILVAEPDDDDAARAVRHHTALRDEATFTGDGLDLRGGDLRGLRLHSASLAHSQLDGVNLRGCELSAANLAGASAYGTVFDDAELDYTNLHNLSAPAASFVGADLQSADAPYAYLREATFRDAFLVEANLAFATLTGADLSGALFHQTRLMDCHLDGATLTGATGSVHGPVYVEPDKLLTGTELAAWFRDNGADVTVLADSGT